MNPIERYEEAKALATHAHRDQRYGTNPYTVHLENVETVLGRYLAANPSDPETSDLCIAAWLHDIVEDTPTTLADVERQFGPTVAKLVDAVTNEPGKNRRERHEKTYPKLEKAGPRAILLKLADRIANVEKSCASLDSRDQGLLSMYRKEHAEFESRLRHLTRHLTTAERMWERLTFLLKETP